ncbi:MAG: DMT family transporter [Phocaeicola sp.]|uniref:DMT family transporter n=1 Tax=Phocaeicola sp. TaxID=2773926 RepID=UPI003FA0C0C5
MKHSYLRLHTAILLAGATGLFGRLITIGELPLVCFRVLLSFIILGIMMSIKKQLHAIPRHHLLMMMGCGVLLTTHWVFYYGSIKAANVSIGAVCFALVGFFTAILEPVIGRRRFSGRELLLSLFTVTGIILIFGLDIRYRFGIALGCISSLLYTIFSIYCKRVQTSTGHSSSTMLLYELIGGGIVLTLILPIYSMVFPKVKVFPDAHDIGLLLLFAAVFTVVPFLLQLQALRTISAFTVNLSYNLEPVYTILLAIIIFNESSELSSAFWVGVLLIILSVVLQTILSIYSKKNRQ